MMDLPVPTEFTTQQNGARTRALVVRGGLDIARVQAMLEPLAATPWDELYHAYGPATDVPGQFAAVIAGDDETRDSAWWDLWGNIHHQGTIYEATVPAVPVLLGLAAWHEHPDRAQALLMLREIALAEGVYVWRYDENEEIATDQKAQERLYPALRSTLDEGVAHLLGQWRTEPEAVQRALLWLLSAFPELHVEHEELIRELLPASLREAWAIATAGGPDSDESADEISKLEDWVYSGAES